MTDTTKTLLAKHGPWAALAGVLIFTLLYEVRPSIALIQAEHREMRAEDAASDATVRIVMEQVRDAMRQNNYLQLRNCMNTARTAPDRDACARVQQ